MDLKEEIKKIEEEEEKNEDLERLRNWEIDGYIKGLYRRVDVIVEYIEKAEIAGNAKETTTITEQQLREDEQHFRENAKEQAWELRNIELIQEIKELTKQLNKQETTKESYDRGFQDGVNYAMKTSKETREGEQPNYNKELIEAMEKVLSIKVPNFDLEVENLKKQAEALKKHDKK